MNYRASITRFLAAAAAAIGCLSVALPVSAQVASGPIVPLKKMEYKTVDPLGGAKLPSMAPGAGPASHAGAAGRSIVGRKAGSAYYSDAAAGRQTGGGKAGSAYYSDAAAKGVSAGGAAYSCPGTARQPIRARGGFRQY